MGQHDEARGWLKKAWVARPWDASLGTALGDAYRLTGDLQGAATTLREVISRDPMQVTATLILSQVLIDLGRAEDAYVLLLGAVRRVADPQIGAALVLAATAAKRYREAAELLDELASATGSQTMRDHAEKLRQMADKAP